MAWIPGTHEETLTIDADYETVRDFFCDPATFQAAFTQLKSAEEIEPDVWRWVLEEKVEKGIKFKADYTVRYERDDNVLTWETIDGNMRSSGRAEVLERDGGAEVRYSETIETELPVPRLMVKVFKPIVQREVDKGVADYLHHARRICEGG